MRTKIIFLLLLVATLSIRAQRYPERNIFIPEHDFRFGVGYKPFEAANITFGDPMDYMIPNFFETKDYYSGARYTSNSWFFEYIYQANKMIGIGLTANYLGYYNDYLDATTNNIIGGNQTHHYSVYPTLRFTFVKTKDISLYSALGFGGRMVYTYNTLKGVSSNGFRTSIGGQITLLGMTVGKNLYCFSDILTLGTQGMFNVGLGYRFTSSIK